VESHDKLKHIGHASPALKEFKMKPFRLFLLASTSLLILVFANSAFAKVSVPSLIGDNMVLQAGKKVRIWGWANPQESITVEFANQKATAITNAKGQWQTLIGPLKAGGPFILTVSGTNTLSFKNVLVGEVWVGSGQSNMEWPLINTKGGAEAVAQANFPEIRLFTVPKKTSASPLENVEGRWVVASPEQVGQFSAVAYYFGRELNQKLKIPVGLIHTSWGGTPAEAWTSHTALATPELQPILDRYELGLKDMPERQRLFEQQLATWVKQNLYVDEGNKGEALGYADPKTSVADWQQMALPQFFETAGLKIDGAVWFRKEIDVPAAYAGQPMELNLAAIDDYDTTYFNGKRVGGVGSETANSYAVPRRYQIPGELVRSGRNVIAVRVFDSAGEGGFGAGQMFLTSVLAASSAISLQGSWNYKVELGLPPKSPDWGSRPQAPGPHNQNSPGVLYNAMLAPLTPYTVRGAIWYQGESNAGRAYQYRTLFPTMIKNWRTSWGDTDFPFYFVQLANWQPMKPEPAESEWAELREAQTLTLREAKTGMAVTIDIGEANDIHPRNKLDVGHRLAVWALAKTYNQTLEFSGPLFKSFSIEGNQIRLKFEHAASGLKTSDGGPVKGFAIAGEDRRFVWAEARIDGNDLVVSSKDVAKPVAVRYAWADNPVTNLYNKAGLPASPFRTDDWPGVTVNRK
jgi:sialate O-acetylesterase